MGCHSGFSISNFLRSTGNAPDWPEAMLEHGRRRVRRQHRLRHRPASGDGRASRPASPPTSPSNIATMPLGTASPKPSATTCRRRHAQRLRLQGHGRGHVLRPADVPPARRDADARAGRRPGRRSSTPPPASRPSTSRRRNRSPPRRGNSSTTATASTGSSHRAGCSPSRRTTRSSPSSPSTSPSRASRRAARSSPGCSRYRRTTSTRRSLTSWSVDAANEHRGAVRRDPLPVRATTVTHSHDSGGAPRSPSF